MWTMLIDPDAGRRAWIAEGLRAAGLQVESRDAGIPEPGRPLESVALAIEACSPDLVAALRGSDPLLPVLVVTRGDYEAATARELGRERVTDIVTVAGQEDVAHLAIGLRDAAADRARRLLARRLDPELTGSSAALQQLQWHVDKAARSAANVLVTGESGSGKEVAARAIHRGSARAAGPFVPVNCSAIPHDLLESELFGHERGAFTGATSTTRGLLEQADGGTLFLDEVGELPPPLQAKLLRVLAPAATHGRGLAHDRARALDTSPAPDASDAPDTTRTHQKPEAPTLREFRRVGGEKLLRADVRVVAATHRPLRALIEEGGFRSDLFQRLAALEVQVPPLRARGKDVLELAMIFLEQASADEGRPGSWIGPAAEKVLITHHWPRNVRQLEAVMRSIVVLKERPGQITLRDLPAELFEAPPGGLPESPDAPMRTLAEVERLHVEHVLARCAGNKTRAAKILGLSRSALSRKLAEWARKKPGQEPS